MDSDFLLIQRMKSGDEQAVDTFVRKYYPAILRYCRLHIPEYDYAEDLTQETFEHFFRTFQTYRHAGKDLNYLYVIAANRCRDYFRWDRAEIPEDIPEQSDSGMEVVDEWLDVRRAVNALPAELKETAILFFFQGLRQKEVAQILGISLPLVKYRVGKAKELLTKNLGQEEL